MKKKLKFIISATIILLIPVLISYLSLSTEQYITEQSNLFKVYYYPNKNLQFLDEKNTDKNSNKIIIKNTTQESYLYQIRVEGEIVNDVYLKYKKDNGQLSNEIYLKNLGKDRIIIETQHMTPSEEDTYIFYIYSKSSQEISNLTFVVEEVTISQDNIEDRTPPTITLNGENELTIYQNEEFIDPGIQSIFDNYDENISVDKVKISYQLEQNGQVKVVEKIDTSIVGTYYIHYHVSDLAKNETNVIRVLHVIEKASEENTSKDSNLEESKQEPEEIPVQFQTVVSYSTKSMTTQPVTVTIMSNEPLVAIEGWDLSKDELKLTRTFASNVTQDILVTSKNGKNIITKISIQNIDKSEWNTDGTIETPTEEEVIIKLNTKEYGTNYINLDFTVSKDKNIKEYSYTCDGNDWTITKTKTIACEKLLQNTTYNVQVKAVTKQDVTYYSNVVTKTTMSLSNPVFYVENEIEWTKTKQVTITYSTKVTGVKYYYKIDNDWIEVSADTTTIEVLKNQIIYAKITDQTNSVEVSREVSHIDREGPTIGNKNLSTSILRSNKIKLNWQKAQDISTTEQELIYYICKNKEEAVCKETPDAKLTNIDTYTFSSLTPNTTYKFQILVEDKLGNYSSYNPIKLKTKELYDISDKKDLVAIMYTTWFNPIYNNSPNISNILAGLESWGGTNQFHYWGKPALGYYRSDDKEVIRKHMIQLEEAGIDFIIIDNTNANRNGWGYGEGSYWHNMVTLSLKALTETIREMRDEGYTTPYIVNWIGTGSGWATTNQIYQDFYTNEDNQELWVYWDNKPFIITTTAITNPQVEIYTRKMWGLQTTLATQEWSYLQISNDKPSYAKDRTIEQIGVSVAMQRSYMSNIATAVGRNHGITFYNQWKTAFKYYPKVVTVTWWNEWAAQRLYVNNTYVFTDNYNQEYSRDIEPMEGGHGDQYYQWLKQYIKAYKGHNSCPRLVEAGY